MTQLLINTQSVLYSTYWWQHLTLDLSRQVRPGDSIFSPRLYLVCSLAPRLASTGGTTSPSTSAINCTRATQLSMQDLV